MKLILAVSISLEGIMNDVFFAPLLLSLAMGISTGSNDVRGGHFDVAAIHGAVPMFVHGSVPMQLRLLRPAGLLLGGRIVDERSNGGRSVDRPRTSIARNGDAGSVSRL